MKISFNHLVVLYVGISECKWDVIPSFNFY